MLELLRFKPAARLKMLVSLLEQPRPILNPARHSSCMDIVERLTGRESPITLRVVDIEAAIGRHPVRLDGAEIGADDVRPRVVFGHFQGPFAGPSADV